MAFWDFCAYAGAIVTYMRPDQQLRASLKEIDDLKAALDEHAIVAIIDPQRIVMRVNRKFRAISKYSRQELLGQDQRAIDSIRRPTQGRL